MIIKYKDKDYEFENGKSIKEILKEEIKKSKLDILTCNFNNEIKSLNYIPKTDGKVELINFCSTEGKRVYVRGIMYITAMAIHNLFPDALLTVKYQLDNSMFCEFDNLNITDKVISKIKEEIINIIEQDIPITKVKMTQDEAEKFFENEKKSRGILQIDMEHKENVSLYYCKDYYNYFYGVMPISTGYLKVFDIVKYANGFLVRYPSKSNPNELKNFTENKKLMSTLEEYENIYKILKLDTIYRLNKKVDEDNAKETILLAEALHEKKISDIADRISKNKKIKMILIAGPSSSGKTTFAKRLRNPTKTKRNSTKNTFGR